MKFEDKIIEVCSNCGTACCWYGLFMCDGAITAGTELKTVKELRQEDSLFDESEDYWSDAYMEKVYGEPASFGYKE